VIFSPFLLNSNRLTPSITSKYSDSTSTDTSTDFIPSFKTKTSTGTEISSSVCKTLGIVAIREIGVRTSKEFSAFAYLLSLEATSITRTAPIYFGIVTL